MHILTKYFIQWYMKLAYAGDAVYLCFLVAWLVSLTYIIKKTLMKKRRLSSLASHCDIQQWKQHYSQSLYKLGMMLTIVVLEMMIVISDQANTVYVPVDFSLYGNASNQDTKNYFDCLLTDNFEHIGVGHFCAVLTIYLYIIATFNLCLKHCAVTYQDKIEQKKYIYFKTVAWMIVSTLAIVLMLSKYTILIGTGVYAVLIISGARCMILSHRILIRSMQAKRCDLIHANCEKSSHVKRINRDLNQVRSIGGFIITIGMLRIAAGFIGGCIGNIIIPILRNPCWIPPEYAAMHRHIDGITKTCAQVAFIATRLVNCFYVLLILTLNIYVVYVNLVKKRRELRRIVNKKYTTYDKPLSRRLLT